MPLRVQYKNHDGSEVYLWQITESIEFFRKNTSINNSKWSQVSQWQHNRIKEWLAGRFLIERFVNCTSKDLIIDEYGKPQIPSQGELSISHSGSYAALYRSNKACGIDIQISNPSILTIAHKYCTSDDLKVYELIPRIEALHYIWCAKEAIYKAYGKKEVDFKKHISIAQTANGIHGLLNKTGEVLKYSLIVTKVNELYMVYGDQIEN